MGEGLRLAEQIEARITDPNWRNEIAARRGSKPMSETDALRPMTDIQVRPDA